MLLLLRPALTTSDIADAKSLWSGGVEWGPANTARANAYWQEDGASPAGDVFPDVAIAGHLYTDQLMAASWSLGISGLLADLSPNTASFSFVGQVTGVPGDDVVISTGLGVAWCGRLDSINETRDTAGHYWTSITATDLIGVLGAATLSTYTLPLGYDLLEVATDVSTRGSVPLVMADASVSGLPDLDNIASPFSGTSLAYLNMAARASNAMVAMLRDGSLSAVLRESVTPASVLTLTGVNAPVSWTKQTTIDVDINKWVVDIPGTDPPSDTADILIYGERVYEETGLIGDRSTLYDDWSAYGGSQRPIVSNGQMVVTSWSQSDLILLDPFQWVTESGTLWQVMSVTHNVSPFDWRVTITADNLLDLL